ncbi:MAG: hypothetical protein ACI8Q9_000942 [Planctomycetota bacterium]|jgi:hypothetical protein
MSLGFKSVLLGTLASFAALHLTPATWIEALYCERVYPEVFRLQNAAFGSLGFPASEGLLAFAFGSLSMLALNGLSKGIRGRCSWSEVMRRGASRLVFLGCICYLAFLGLWGFHHGRLPYATHLGLDRYPGSQLLVTQTAELEALCRTLVDGCNDLQPLVTPHRMGQGSLQERAVAIQAMSALSKATPMFHGLEPSFRLATFSPLLSRLGISGIYSPFTGDAHINGQQPNWSQPFTACHEMAHQLGIAREGEANFVAWQACMGSDSVELRYSAYMAALGPACNALFGLQEGREDSVVFAILDGLSPEVKAERESAAIWWAEQMGLPGDLARATNHVYLQSQGQGDGVASYGFLVDLILAERRRDSAGLGDGKETAK